MRRTAGCPPLAASVDKKYHDHLATQPFVVGEGRDLASCCKGQFLLEEHGCCGAHRVLHASQTAVLVAVAAYTNTRSSRRFSVTDTAYTQLARPRRLYTASLHAVRPRQIYLAEFMPVAPSVVPRPCWVNSPCEDIHIHTMYAFPVDPPSIQAWCNYNDSP